MALGTSQAKSHIAALAAIGLMAAMATPVSAEAGCNPASTEGILGGIAGAALGGFLGSKIGSGSGRTVATIGGALAGGLLGNQAVTLLTCQDHRAVYDTTQSTLEQYPSGRTATWNNPDSGHWGTVKPTRTYLNDHGQNCRQFEQTIYIDGNPKTGTGLACRQRDGTWQIVDG